MLYPSLASSVWDSERQAGWYHTWLMQASNLPHTSRYECLIRIGAGWPVNFISILVIWVSCWSVPTTWGISTTIKIFSWVDPFSLGWCSGYHGWRDRGRSHQVFGPSLFGRIRPVWQGSLCKRNKQVSKPVQWLLMTPHCWFPCCDSSFASGLGTFWCQRKTTLCWRNGWNQFWNRCCWSRTLKWDWVLGFLFGFSFCPALCGSRYSSSSLETQFFSSFIFRTETWWKIHICFSSLREFTGLHQRWSTDSAKRSTTLNLFTTGPTRWVLHTPIWNCNDQWCIWRGND